MKFQILKLVIWPKSEQFAPREVEFQAGKLNVITGASRTGKSAIIPIIDYCLASSDCFIPIDTIRDHATWYGVVFQTEIDQLLICREVPNGNKVSNKFYCLRGSKISIPPKIINENESLEGIKNILNAISSVPYISLDSDENRKAYQARLGFRDLVALIFQNQDIVANQNILFYKTHAHEHRERLRNWFPYILGAETIEILTARQRIQEIEKKLNQLKREFDKAKAISTSWLANMLGQIKIAKEYGLVNQNVDISTSSNELLAIAKEVVANIPEYSKSSLENIEHASKEISTLDAEENVLSNQISIVKKRLNDLKNLKSGFTDYGNSVKKRVERLHISKWFREVATESEVCIACGSNNHPNSKAEIDKIIVAFEKCEAEAQGVAEVPTSFSREEDRLQSELEKLLENKKELQSRYDLLISRDKGAQEEFQMRKNMFLFIGHLKASTETFESLVDGGTYQIEIESLQEEFDRLSKIVDLNGVQKRVYSATAKISQGILNHLKTLDVEEKYRKIAPRFDIKDLNISVLSNDNNWHFLAEVGSASNWVSFHIGLMCSMQEYFLEQSNSCVPSFVIFDQPSQVYFPKLKKVSDGTSVDQKFNDEDVDAVKNIFRTIANSINATKGGWQSIILDHADDTIYGGIEGVYEVDVWRDGKKLIPEAWYL